MGLGNTFSALCAQFPIAFGTDWMALFTLLKCSIEVEAKRITITRINRHNNYMVSNALAARVVAVIMTL